MTYRNGYVKSSQTITSQHSSCPNIATMCSRIYHKESTINARESPSLPIKSIQNIALIIITVLINYPRRILSRITDEGGGNGVDAVMVEGVDAFYNLLHILAVDCDLAIKLVKLFNKLKSRITPWNN